MKYFLFVILSISLAGCSTPNPYPKATEAVYEQIKVGMTRQEVYALLGPPRSVRSIGGVEQVAKWGIPHDNHGWGTWKVTFIGDSVTQVNNNHATASFSAP